MIDTQEKTIVGTLVSQGKNYEMLDLYPARHPSPTPWLLKEHTFEFLVVIDGYAQPVIVSRNSFMIIPSLEVKTIPVKFIVDGKEEDEQIKIDDLQESLHESD